MSLAATPSEDSRTLVITRTLKAPRELDELAVDLNEAELGLHASQSLVEIDGLRDIVDCADIKSLEFALFRRARSNEDYRNSAGLLIGL